MSYDALGNIQSKSGVGLYSYEEVEDQSCVISHAGPHAVARITAQKTGNKGN